MLSSPRGASLLLGGLVLGASMWYWRNQTAGSSVVQGVSDTIIVGTASVLDFMGNEMISVKSSMGNSNLRAFLAMIRVGEGTADSGGYHRLFGGRNFASLAVHPRIAVPFGDTTSSAAGAYQILARTWDEIAGIYGLTDFSEVSQDIAAAGLIKRRGALADVLAGRFEAAILKCNREWASLPGSPYGQPTVTMSSALASINRGLV